MFVGVSTALTAVRRVFHPFVREGLKLYYRFTGTFDETTPDFLLDGSTSFDGSNDYISIADADNLSFGDGSTDSAFSVSAWVKMDDATNFHIIDKGIYNSDGEWNFKFDSSDKLTLVLFDESVSSTLESQVSDNALTSYQGQWIHLAGTYDGRGGTSANDGIKLYLNGSILASTGSDSGTYVAMENLGGSVNIGALVGYDYSNGSMANIGIWNRALSASEIESIYWRGSYSELKDTELTNLTAWYNLFSTSAGSEIITNGDFSSFSSGQATSWTTTGSPTLSEETTIVQSGSSQKIFMATSGNNGIDQAITTVKGAEYTFSAKVYVTGGRARVILDNGTDDGNTYVGTGGTTGYTDLNTWHTVTFTKTSQSTTMTARLWTSSADTTFYVDDVSLKLVSETPDSVGTNHGAVAGATINTDSYSGESPFKPRIQDIATPKMAVQLADGSTDFDGTNDYISASATVGATHTFACWVKLDTGTGGDNIRMLFDWTGNDLYYGYRNDKIFSYDYSSTAVYGGTTLSTGQWHHIAFVRNGTSGLTYYLNGSVDGTANTVSKDWSGSFTIGGRSSGYFHDGSIANVAIYSSALTQLQIQELMFTEKYSGLSSDLKTNLVSWYDLGARVQTGSDVVYDKTNATLGDELIVNGDFSSALGSEWDLTLGGGGGSISLVSNQLKMLQGGSSSTLYASQDFTTEVGATYQFTVDLVSSTATTWIKLLAGTSQNGSQVKSSGYSYVTAGATNALSFVATATTTWITIQESQGAGSSSVWDNVSVKKVSGNAGIVSGATTTTGYTSSPHGVVDPLNYGEVYSGRALDFDGSNDEIAIPDTDTLSFGDGSSDSAFSISAWINMDDATNFDIINKGTYNSDAEWRFFVNSIDTLEFLIYDESVSSTIEQAYSTKALTSYQGQWIHVASTYDGRGGTSANAGITLYVNGVSQSLTLDDGGTYVAMENLGDEIRIGNYNDTSYADGKINNLKVFSAQLTQAQIQELYRNPEQILPTGVSASNLKLDLPMQEGSGSYIYDGSGNQNHGTIYGATWATGESDGYQSSLVRSNTPMIFDGTDDYVEISNPMITGTSDFTFSIWINKQNDISSARHVAGNYTGSNLQGIQFGINGDEKFYTYTDGTNDYVTCTTALSSNVWNHLVVTRSSNSVVIYLNGSSDATGTLDNDIGNSSNFFIGANPAEDFTGLVNEIAIWDVALDADAVTALYGSGTPLLPTSDSGNYDNSGNLTGYWRNDGNTTWTDRTPLGAYGSDMLTNGGFDSDTVWTRQSGWTIGSGVATCDGTNASYIYQSSGTGGLPKNTKISVSLDITSYTSGSVRIGATTVTSDTVSGLGTHTAIFTTRSGGDSGIEILSNSFIGSIDNVVIKKYRGGNDGTASGSPVSIVIPEGSTSGRDNQGFLLSDTTSISNGMRVFGSEYVSIQDSEVLSFGDGTDDKSFSVEAWIKMDDATSFIIVSKGVYNSTAEYLFCTNGADKLLFELYDESVSSTYEASYYNTALTSHEGSWIHVCATYDGRAGTSANAGIKLYLNGSSVTTTLSGGGTYVAMENLGADVHIGRNDSTYSKGLIDEVRIYQKELSASEVLKNYNNGKSAHQ